MKRLFLLVLALIVSFLLTELLVSSVIGYPKYVTGSRKFFLDYAIGPYKTLTWRAPRYPSWSVEGGNVLLRYSNVGLPGPDIDLSNNAGYVAVLGNSYIEGMQVSPDESAVAYLNNSLQQKGSRLQAINLGSSAHDPYVLWYRLLFFEHFFKIDKVILVYERFSRMRSYFSRWDLDSINFPDSLQFQELQMSNRKKVFDAVRAESSFMNIMTTFKNKDTRSNNETTPSASKSASQNVDQQTFMTLKAALSAFHRRYGANFAFVSLMRDNPFKADLDSFCTAEGINYLQNDTLIVPENLINGEGHFNKKGHEQLGKLLSELQ